MSKPSLESTERRSFLTRLNAGTAALAALALGGTAVAKTKSPATKWEPTRHDQDNWIDELPGKHRMVIDTTSNEALGDGLLFASNFIVANRDGYGLKNTDAAIIVVVRHLSTGFGFDDAMWAKYGAQIGPMSGIKTEPPKVNPHGTGGLSIDSVTKQGVKIAVCAMATRRLAGQIAQGTGGTADAINAELIANLVPEARMVPAGIIVLNRAQERGYSFVKA
jgi:intracellular sulfur oxidation DsrE/DsrF family protein